MNKLYRFSPIRTEEQLIESIRYIDSQARELSNKIIKKEYPLSSLTIFSHYPDEFEQLKEILFKMGEQQAENNGPYVRLVNPLVLRGGALKFVLVIKPDPYRMQVGCCDFNIPDYDEFKSNYLKSTTNKLRLIERVDHEMIEFFDPDFDILAYVVNKPLL